MGFWSALFGDNKSKTHTFSHRMSYEAKREWFAKTAPWARVPAHVIDVLLERFSDDGSMFEVFVDVSAELGTVSAYATIPPVGRAVASVVSTMLLQAGERVSRPGLSAVDAMSRGRRVSDRKLQKAATSLTAANKALMSAIELDERNFAAYMVLVQVLDAVDRRADAVTCALRGLRIVQDIRRSAPPFHLSGVDSVRQADASLRQAEEVLAGLAAGLSRSGAK